MNLINGVAKSFSIKKKTFNLKLECTQRRNLVTACADSYKLPKWFFAIIVAYGFILLAFQSRALIQKNIFVKNVKNGAHTLKKT